MGTLDEILARLDVLPRAQRDAIVQSALQATKGMVWVPNPGSQLEAFKSEADEIGYGGEAGPGKTDLIIGLSLTQHKRSLILRRTNKEASKLVERYAEILGSRDGWNGKDDQWRLPDRLVDIGGVQLEDDKQKYKGGPHDLVGFDEVVDFTQSQYEFIIAWNRSTDQKQRCRVIATMNPPTRPVGLWVMKRWGPWLDPNHPKPARSGEIRWFTAIDGVDTEVDGPGPHMVEGKPVMAKSRTFIRGHLEENPDLAGTGYEGRLAGLPKELRTAYLEGKFEASLRDSPNQCIPSSWVRAAQQRWTRRAPSDVPMCAIGVDASGGGDDPMILACRHDGWYAPLIEIPGKQIPMDRQGAFCGGVIVSYRRDDALVIVDLGGGYGSATYEHLKANRVEVQGFKGAEKTIRRSADKKLAFVNTRSAAYWTFREALDPGQPGGSPISLPDDPMLVAELTTPTFEPTPNGIRVEPKEDVIERLGHSPDRADAVVMAWWAGPKEVTNALEWADQREARRPMARKPVVVMRRDLVRNR